MINPIDISGNFFSLTPHPSSAKNPSNHSIEQYSTPTDSVSLSTNAQALQRIESLELQLDGILGTPKQLSAQEQQQEEQILNEIEAILGGTDGSGINQAAQKRMDSIYQQIDKIFEDDRVTEDEEKQLSALGNRLDQLFESFQEPELSSDQEQQLNTLYDRLDSLYGLQQPSKEELLKVERIMGELDQFYSHFSHFEY